jgi:hypothetical protein
MRFPSRLAVSGVYYSSQIILMGAEITQAFAKIKARLKRREWLKRQQKNFNGKVALYLLQQRRWAVVCEVVIQRYEFDALIRVV